MYINLKRNIPKFDTGLLQSNWSSVRRKYLRKIPTDVNALSCGPKTWKSSGISDAISPARHPQKSSQHVRACAAGDGAICSKNRKIVPYHADSPNIRNGARLRSQSPIMAPDIHLYHNPVREWQRICSLKYLCSTDNFLLGGNLHRACLTVNY